MHTPSALRGGPFLRLPAARVAAVPSRGNNLMPQCTFTATPAGGPRVSLTVNVDNGPQPYFILERTAVETAQYFGLKRLAPPPTAINGLGIEADWFPDREALMSTDGFRLITASVQWLRTSVARQISLATALSRTYLKVVSEKQASALARGCEPTPNWRETTVP